MGQVGVGGRDVENVQESRVRKDGIVNDLPRFKNFRIKVEGYTVVVEEISRYLCGNITI